MPIFDFNEEQKIRISMSTRAYQIMQDDMSAFNETRPAFFINTIIENYKETSIASLTTYLENWKNDYRQKLSGKKNDVESAEAFINSLAEQEEKRIKSILKEHLKNHQNSRIYHINKTNCDYLYNEFEDSDFYGNRPGLYIKCLMEEYACLPFIEREEIYRKPVYDVINLACASNRLMQVEIVNKGLKETLYVYPYKIMPDSMNTQSYLACYTRHKDEPVSAKIDASFAMSRIKMPKILNQTAFLSKEDKNKIENDIRNLSINYLFGNESEIRVKLSDFGKRHYQNYIISRPIKDEALSTNDVYVFHCSENQAFNYFFSFGAEAEVLCPPSLRNRIIDCHQKSLNNYCISE